MKKLTINKAVNQAINESSMYKIGNSWQISIYDDNYKTYVQGQQGDYLAIRGALRRWRIERIGELLGINPFEAYQASLDEDGKLLNVAKRYFAQEENVK